jgi:glycosyltransferase involved in cell wall biosynthesis
LTQEVAKPYEVDVVVPARNAEATLPALLASMPRRMVRSVVVVDNGSQDRSARLAEAGGAVVLRESRLGYGAACLRGIAHVCTLPKKPDAVVFCAADGSCDAAELPALLAPLRDGLFDLVMGSRTLGQDPLAAHEKAGNLVAVNLISALYGHRYSDLGPFRAIRYPALVALGLRDPGEGWLVEMQVKALKVGLRIAEVPVSYRPPDKTARMHEKVRGTVNTGTRSLFQILRHATAR